MLVLNISQKNVIPRVVKILKTGGLIIYPTETCYGAGVDPTNPTAVAKILNYKTFRQGKPISIAVANQTMASKYITPNTSALNLYNKFMPGPLTVISQSRHKVVKQVESSTGTLGIRIPDYPFILKLIAKFGRPITATSANVSYKPKPYSLKQLLKYTSQKQQGLIDLFIDAGTLPRRPSSTVVDTTFDDPLIIRQGRIKFSNSNFQFSNSPLETMNLAQTLMLKHWKNLQKQPLIFLLIGDLGSGKTQFAKGIGQFLGIKTPITSPTYTLEKEYPYTRHQVSGLFLHLDTWRMQTLVEFNQLNLTSRLKPKNVLAIEWADRTLTPLLKLAQKTKAKVITVKISVGSSPTHRRLIF
ncbi:MAG: L-threonylcarbamoyladenylate synthase [Patescibacteria group bacterium]|nr:L-threonylcarbamoyladenylate synthase [Patescibacteria group bacterium]